MIITIDGPAGAGKSSVAKELARRLGYRFLDTGAMYRAVAFAALQEGIDPNAHEAVADLVDRLNVQLVNDRVVLNDSDVTSAIRSWAVTNIVAAIADNQHVRSKLVEWQRASVRDSSIITEGRDQGTLVFPQAGCKIFLTASSEIRAQRRHKDLLRRGESLTFDEVLQRQERRDQRDRERPVGRLVPADDAIRFCTDGLDLAEVVDQLEDWIRKVCAHRNIEPAPDATF